MLRLGLSGTFTLHCRDRRGRHRWTLDLPNGVTTEGVNTILGVGFGAVAAITPYVGLIAESGYTGVSASDTHATHSGWNEWTLYSGNRPAWVPQASAGGGMGTLVPITWTMTAGGQLRGAFIASQAAKTTGPGAIIYCTAVAAAALTVALADVITCTYTLTIRE